ncbi:MAG: transcriptional regulator NrdR [Candidatus Omnitrophica bacterium CG07_land_8_20_14_0_80_50_8]|nr:MAG: transcriptional regulator NrdR [Candidatus Omnitrophica bacterium CG07_land_8_20_14_0_80_50_8]
MKCPFCGFIEDKVIDSRSSNEDKSVRRRRECMKCKRRFTTYEYIEEMPLMLIKKDGRREAFDRNKIISGILKACEKRPVSVDKIEGVVDKIEKELQKNFDKEVKAQTVGELVMDHLHKLDQVAYVRFASVYRQFKDINQFMKELQDILNDKKAAR